MDIHVTLQMMRNTDLPMDERVEAAINVLVWFAKTGDRAWTELGRPADIVAEAEALIIAATEQGDDGPPVDEPDRPVPMPDAWRRRYAKWTADRQAIGEREDIGEQISAETWNDLDDTGIALLEELDPDGPPLSAIDRLRDAVNSYGWDSEGLNGSAADHAAILYDLLNDLGMGRWSDEGARSNRAVLDEPGTKVRVTVLMEGELLGGADQGINLALILGQASGALMLASENGVLADADGTPLLDGNGNTRAMIEVVR